MVVVSLAFLSISSVFAQDRKVVGNAGEESPYDRFTGGNKVGSKSNVEPEATVVEEVPAAPTPVVSPTDKKKEFPKSGVLSMVVPQGFGRTGISTISSPDLENDELPPIAGSVRRSGADSWIAKVSNNTEDSYSTSIRINQLSETGSIIKSDSFSYTLKPKGSVERTFSALASSKGAQLILERYTSSRGKESKPTTAAKSTQTP